MPESETYFRRGLGMAKEVQPVLDAEYYSALIAAIQAAGHTARFGDLTVKLARTFGFCYGVERAVEYAYQTAVKFRDRRILLLGEIIHNPYVNQRLREMGIEFIRPDQHGEPNLSGITGDDVVIIPAFGLTLRGFERLRRIGCVLVDTTCGSVLNVWKRVDGYARDGFTAVIHGKYRHEETRATASQVGRHGGRFAVIRNIDEAQLLIDYIEKSKHALSHDEIARHFRDKTSPDFDPDRDLVRIGVANQTTMLSSESLVIAAAIRESLARRYGHDRIEQHFRSFDTICSATQERQDAVRELMQDPPDIMIVVGGYNSSNTNHLAHLCRGHTTTFHISDAAAIDPVAGSLRHKPALDPDTPEVVTTDWLPDGSVTVGLTGGASTPNSKIGQTLERVLATLGIPVPPLA